MPKLTGHSWLCGGQGASTHQLGCGVLWCECPCHDTLHEQRRLAYVERHLQGMPDYSETGLREGMAEGVRVELDETVREAYRKLHHTMKLIDRAYMRNTPGPVHSDIAAAFYGLNSVLMLLRAITPMEDYTLPKPS